VRIDRSDDGDADGDGDERPDVADAPGVRGTDAAGCAGPNRDAAGKDAGHGAETASSVRVERALEHRANVDAVNRAYAIDQGCARVQEIEEKTVTPAMRRIEAEDPGRHLAGLEHRLKGRQRIEEKVMHDVQKKGLSAEQAFADMKDAIRYTFKYPEDKYTPGVQADAQRLKDEGGEFVDSRNTWTSEQYKGINSWWREGNSGQLFEVQFHTQASLDAKQETHAAYERLRTLPADTEEVRDLRAYQREVNAKVRIPPGAPDIVIS
jgi:hypothetical protein